MRFLTLYCVLAMLLAGCAGQFSGLPADASTRTLTIRWQRLVDTPNKTCPRCATTEQAVQKAFAHLRRSLAPAGVQVTLETDRIDAATFSKEPLESNRIWIAGRPLEEWVGAQTAASPCSGPCAASECRTVCVEGETHEAIPAHVIIRAGILAASDALRLRSPTPTTE